MRPVTMRAACARPQILYFVALVLSCYINSILSSSSGGGLASATLTPQDEQDLGSINVNKLGPASETRNNNDVYISPEEMVVAEEDEGGESESGMENEVPTDDDVVGAAGPAFTWQHHRDDHGGYAGRSLMTSASSKPLEAHHKGALEAASAPDDDEAESSKLRARDDHEENQHDPLRTVDFAEKEWQLMFRAFDSAYESMSSSILQEIGKQTNLFEDIVSKLRPQCRRDIHYVRESVKKHKLWALRMLDSNGKLPSGITYGRFSSPGDYEECLSVQVDDQLFKPGQSPSSSSTGGAISSKPPPAATLERHKFHGKYCLLDFRLPLPERPRNKLLSVHESVLNFTGTEIGRLYPDMIANYSAYASVFYEVGYLHGFCLPSSCDVHELARSMTKALEGMYLIVNNTVDCEERPPAGEPGASGRPVRPAQWISIVLMAIVFANALAASLAHYLLPRELKEQSGNQQRAGGAPPEKPPTTTSEGANNNNKNNSNTAKSPTGGGGGLQETLRKLSQLEEVKRGQIARHRGATTTGCCGLVQRLTRLSMGNKFYSDCFSIQKNFERLTKPDPRGLTFVHYTRIVAMALTVITHTGALGTLQAITKPADASNSEQIFRDFIPQMLANAFTSIQIFFFMAGFMLVISTYPSIRRDRGHISFLEYAIKRAIRLMPGIAATICLNFIWPLLVDGPMLSYFDRMIVAPCETTWWHTLGFVSNFDHVEKMCLRHSYFSASDYQLHIMAFPLLILLYRQPSLSLFLAGLLTLSGFVAQIIMILTKTVLPFMMVDYIDKEAFFNVVHYIHHPVWNHMSAFFYGFIVGYLVVRQIRVELAPTTIKRTWLVMIPAGVLSIFAPYFWNHYKRPIHKWQMVLYVIFDRAILLTTCAWLSYATMVLARKPPGGAASTTKPRAGQQHQEPTKPDSTQTGGGGHLKSPIERVLTKAAQSGTLAAAANFEKSAPADGTRLRPMLGAGGSSGSLASLPRQRSSPNLIVGAQQHQHQPPVPHSDLLSPGLGGGRLSRTTSSSNLATIAETGGTGGKSGAESAPPAAAAAQQTAADLTPRPARTPPPVSNINTLCLVLSRLTFQLYLFNMVVLWIDVNHSKYFWFFSYYFIVFKAASIYIYSALLAMVFFVVLESPCLTLYIAWVKGRAVARGAAKSAAATAAAAAAATAASNEQKSSELVRVFVPQAQHGPATRIVVVDGERHNQQDKLADDRFQTKQPQGEPMELTRTSAKPGAFPFIDELVARTTNRTSTPDQPSASPEAGGARTDNQTKM